MAWTKQQAAEYRKEWNRRNKDKRALYARRWRAKHPEKAKELEQRYKEKYGKRYYAEAMRKARGKDPRRAKNTMLRNSFGITVEEYERMFAEQGGLCACCREPERRTVRREPNKGKTMLLCVDHDHGTGQVRELLCGACNSAVGFLKERVWVAERVIEYLKKWGK